MHNNERWLLPEGIEEVLPREALQLEQMRRRLVDLYASWGYELVIPPLIEYLDALLTGTGNDLELQTFKLTDQLSGRLLGIRADMTPQVARIDNHQLKRTVPTRLCYLGTVLHTRPAGMGGTRSPIQVGAELYGHSGIESDIEVLTLMLETLRQLGLDEIHLDLGHVGIFRSLAAEARLSAAEETEVFDALQRKSLPEIGDLLAQITLADEMRAMLLGLAGLNGGREVIAQGRTLLSGAGPAVQEALDYLVRLADVAEHFEGVTLHFDLAELRGYHYHTGAVFAAYAPGQGQALAVGGRYDDIGRVFGRPRSATGFSCDLKRLLALAPATAGAPQGVFAPAAGDDRDLEQRVRALRESGERVIRALPGQSGGAREMGCDRVLARVSGEWRVGPANF